MNMFIKEAVFWIAVSVLAIHSSCYTLLNFYKFKIKEMFLGWIIQFIFSEQWAGINKLKNDEYFMNAIQW